MTTNTNRPRIGVVGATGVVGETFLTLLEEREFPLEDLRLFASENSQGQTRKFCGREIAIEVLHENCFQGLDLVFFSSGDDISKTWAPRTIAQGAMAVDNSGAFRMDSTISLVVPEINGHLLPKWSSLSRENRSQPQIIANPNCSTIQLVLALEPLKKKYGLRGVRVASYQSVSGAGRNGIEELFSHTRLAMEGEEAPTPQTFPQSIAFNCIPQIGPFDANGFCTEEVKIMKETRKILSEPELYVSAFTVRVPTMNAHAEAVWVTLDKKIDSASEIESCLAQGRGLEVIKNSSTPPYPTQIQTSGRNPVYVGRVHRDLFDTNTWMMWVVGDNLRKGAALNGLQIAEHIFDITHVE